MIDLLEILKILSKHQVEFCLVGGLAAATYGSSMLTQDVDVACSMSIPNLIKLHEALALIHPMHRMVRPHRAFTREDAESGLYKNIYLHTDIGQLDCLGEVKGIGDFDAVMERSAKADSVGFSFSILSLDALIEAKESMGRPRDLENAKILRAIRERNSQN